MAARAWRLLLGAVLFEALFLAPGWWITRSLDSTVVLLEVALVIGVFALLRRNGRSMALATVSVIVLVSLAVLSIGDVLARQSLARPLNLYLDLALITSVGRLLTGAVGLFWSTLAAVATLATILLTGWALRTLLVPHTDQTPARPQRYVGLALVVFSLLGMAGIGFPAQSPLTAMPAVWLVRDQIAHGKRMLGERSRFEAEMAASPASYDDTVGLLAGLEGRDVVLGFIESYGVSTLYDPRYSPIVQPTLQEMAKEVERAGLHMVTGTLVAPSQGGQSWFAHGSILSGLWLDNQLRYDLLLASSRSTLVDDFRAAGYRSAAIMPAITLAWPEGERFGYDEIYAAADMDYAGPPLNWVTMPDQFTWSFLERAVRTRDDSQPVFAEIGLISSHAPWTPILEVLDDWDTIGRGEVFDRWEDAGETPGDLWQDHDRVRDAYALSVRYALQAATSYASRYVGDHTLLIILGDHQPAPMITGENASPSVPVHVISGDMALLQPFVGWGFQEGPEPASRLATKRMDDFRDWFVRAFSDNPAWGS